MKQHAKQKGNQTPVVCLLGAACVVALIVLIAVAIISGQKTPDAGKFTPPPFEANAVSGVPEVDETLGWSEISVRKGYVAHVCGVLRANTDGTVAVWFSSDADNTVWLKLRLKNADGVTVGETGLLKPGEYVEMLQLNDLAKAGNVTLHIMGYEPETYYSAGAVNLTTKLEMTD